MKKGKNLLALILVMTFVIAMIPVFPQTLQAKAKKPKLNKTSITLEVNGTEKLKLKNAKGKVKWSSSDPSVAEVDKSGKVTAKAAGNAIVTAKNKGKEYSCEVTVQGGQPEKSVMYLSIWRCYKQTEDYLNKGVHIGVSNYPKYEVIGYYNIDENRGTEHMMDSLKYIEETCFSPHKTELETFYEENKTNAIQAYINNPGPEGSPRLDVTDWFPKELPFTMEDGAIKNMKLTNVEANITLVLPEKLEQNVVTSDVFPYTSPDGTQGFIYADGVNFCFYVSNIDELTK